MIHAVPSCTDVYNRESNGHLAVSHVKSSSGMRYVQHINIVAATQHRLLSEHPHQLAALRRTSRADEALQAKTCCPGAAMFLETGSLGLVCMWKGGTQSEHELAELWSCSRG